MALAGEMSRKLTGSVCALGLLATPAWAADPPIHDYRATLAGDYRIDNSHTAVVAKVLHQGFSYSQVRFGKTDGDLMWDPAHPDQSKLDVTVETGSITTPVLGLGTILKGGSYLATGKFPKARFISSSFKASDAEHGVVEGVLTLKGVDKPVSFDVTLVGAGKGIFGQSIGVSGQTRISSDGLDMPKEIQEIILTVDLEFVRRTEPTG